MRDISLIRRLPVTGDIPFIKARHIAAALSVLMMIASVFLFFTKGLNYGIDFSGGTVIEVDMGPDVDQAEIRSTMNDLFGGSQVSTISPGLESDVDYEYLRIGIPMQPETEETGAAAQQIAMAQAEEALREINPEREILSQSSVSGQVSGELRRKGFLAVGLALAMVLAYISVRFEWQFGVGAVAALFHDVIITIGVFSLTQMEFNLTIVAAVLTIIGYSLNDTVIVYDRIRENMRKFKTKPLPDLINLSINDMLSRTLMTSLSTLLALTALYIFGGEGLRGFSFAMIWGIIIGTYSSIFVASPILILLGVRRGTGKMDVNAASAVPSPAGE